VRRYLCSLAAVDHILSRLYVDEVDKRVLAQIAVRKGVTNATRRRDLTAVSVVLHAAERRGWLEQVPVYRRRALRESARPLALPMAREVRMLMAALPQRLRSIVLLLEQTGLRLEEAGGLRWDQVDLRRRTITLTHTKANRVRVVPLTEEAVGTLSGTPRHLSCPYVFWHSQDGPKRYSDLSGLLYDYRKRAGVSWRIHDLRHLFAVRYLQQGGSIYDLQKILGHSTIAVTERYLDHLTPAEQATAKRTAS
jgi:integrase/recombinase XerD